MDLITFIFTTNACLSVLGPFTHIPPAGINLSTGDTVNLQVATRSDREACGWYELDESDRPVTYSNEYAKITQYTRTDTGYKASYEIAWTPASSGESRIDPSGLIVPGPSGKIYIGETNEENSVVVAKDIWVKIDKKEIHDIPEGATIGDLIDKIREISAAFNPQEDNE